MRDWVTEYRTVVCYCDDVPCSCQTRLSLLTASILRCRRLWWTRHTFCLSWSYVYCVHTALSSVWHFSWLICRCSLHNKRHCILWRPRLTVGDVVSVLNLWQTFFLRSVWETSCKCCWANLIFSHIDINRKTSCKSLFFVVCLIIWTKYVLSSSHILRPAHIYNHTQQSPTLRLCSATWGWASNPRNMSRLWTAVKWNVKCVSSWYYLLRNYR
jgi:hypothetical protein